MDEEGLWQLAINFACQTSGFPPSGWVGVDVAISFCVKFEMALELMRRKSYEFMDEIENEEDYDHVQGHWIGNELKGWLQRQRLPPTCVGDLMQDIRAAGEDSERNLEEAFKIAFFKHIRSPSRHPDHVTWWIQSLEWFHKALMSEGQIVQSEGKKLRFAFNDSSHLVLHAVKHGARMKHKTIMEYFDDAVKWWERSEEVNHMDLPMPHINVKTNGTKELITPQSPPRRLVMKPKGFTSAGADIQLKTYHVRTKGDSGAWPNGPYDILKAERLQHFVNGP